MKAPLLRTQTAVKSSSFFSKLGVGQVFGVGQVLGIGRVFGVGQVFCPGILPFYFCLHGSFNFVIFRPLPAQSGICQTLTCGWMT